MKLAVNKALIFNNPPVFKAIKAVHIFKEAGFLEERKREIHMSAIQLFFKKKYYPGPLLIKVFLLALYTN